jgi:hypothetical protein
MLYIYKSRAVKERERERERKTLSRESERSENKRCKTREDIEDFPLGG